MGIEKSEYKSKFLRHNVKIDTLGFSGASMQCTDFYG